ncbi:cytochrome c oxidase assembly factor CtaG [Rhodococcus erythropolis]|uniref:hypothetical protein n=1 Tax=Rhodococcus erythropolis TaxID=1833 RepID=UPI0021670851|nr:hypothetical protein [Rhodococcus erythropolis]MCS4257840.1 cytochrome c oxidase assembly factor CtaG [Rhodococcus erythropolis]MCW2425144.1 cytochrome c oxidase assembly factor CtaG [Rhodococcus erythropolis]
MTTTEHSQPPAAASHDTLPDPGKQVPTLSWPIVGIFTGALAVFGISTWVTVTDSFPALATIAASGAAIFVMFTVLHDASHYSISSHRWVNVAFGRVAVFFVSPLIPFSLSRSSISSTTATPMTVSSIAIIGPHIQSSAYRADTPRTVPRHKTEPQTSMPYARQK